MTLEKAIEIKIINNDHNPNYTNAEREQAHQLGIEALEVIKALRKRYGPAPQFNLPSETPEAQ